MTQKMTEKTIAKRGKGWKPIPLPFKILFVLFILWSVGAVMNLPNLFKNGLPLFGIFVYGKTAALIVIMLDIIGPLTFLFALWNRKSWAVKWAFSYIGLFILNGAIALFTVRDDLGLPQILVPIIASIIFLAVIYWKRDYFKQTPL
jgi:uncharacterized membrane protein